MIGMILFLIIVGLIVRSMLKAGKRLRAKRYTIRTSGAVAMRRYLRRHFNIDETLWATMQDMNLADLQRLAHEQEWIAADQWNTVLHDQMAAAMFRDQLQTQHDLDAALMEQIQWMNLMELQDLAVQQHWMTLEYANETAQQLDQMIHEQQFQTMMQDDFIMQQHLDMTDPYQHAGLDIVVDESFHGIDHGDGFTHDFSHDMGGGFPD